MQEIVRIVEPGEDRLDADLAWWAAAGARARVEAVDAARRDAEKMGVVVPSDPPRGVNADFEDWLRLLNEEGVQYLVVGAYAVAYYATPRFTKDLDVLFRPTEDNAKKLISALTRFIGAPDVAVSRLTNPDFLMMIGVPPTRIDLLASIDGVDFDEAWARRTRGPYGEQEVFYIGLADLIAAKRAAGRPQDELDLERLERVARDEP